MQEVKKKVHTSSNAAVINPKGRRPFGNWRRNGAIHVLRRTCWRFGSLVSGSNAGWNQAPTDIWFQDVTAVGNGSQICRRISYHYLRVDVGGGAVKNETRNALARIPLRWMVRQCFLADTGIMFNGQLLAKIGLDPGTLYPRVLRRPDAITFERADHSRIASGGSSGMVTVVNEKLTLTEEEEDLADILSPVNDELSRSKSWWLLEVMPLKTRHQKKDGNWIWRTRYVRLHT